MKSLLAQVGAEIRMTLERGETLLVTVGIPAFLLVFFSLVKVLPTGTARPVDFLGPGVLGLAVMSTAMVSLGIATGFERSYGVLKRLGSTPLGRGRLVLAKIVAVFAVEVLQIIVLGAIAFGLGWRPRPAAGLAVVAAILATFAFAGIGLALSGALRAELNLALLNALYIVMLLLGGIVFPLSKLGHTASGWARALPAAALTQILHPTLAVGASPPAIDWAILAAWAVGAPIVAVLAFRWE